MVESLKGILVGAAIGAVATILGTYITAQSQFEQLIRQQIVDEEIRAEERLIASYADFMREYGNPDMVWDRYVREGESVWDNFNVHILSNRMLGNDAVSAKMNTLFDSIPKIKGDRYKINSSKFKEQFRTSYFVNLDPLIDEMGNSLRQQRKN